LTQLFPASAQHLGGSRHSPEGQGTWRHARRVAYTSVLQVYLSKQIQPTEVPTPVVVRVVGLLADAQALGNELATLQPAQLADLLTRLEDYEGSFPDEIGPSIPVRYGLRARLPGQMGMFDVEPRMRVSRVVLRMLRGRTQAVATQIVEEAIPQLGSLSDRWLLIRLVGHIEGSGHELVSESQAEQWESDLVDAILGAQASDLAAEPDLSALLGLVISRKADLAREIARRGAEDDRFLLRLLSTFAHEVRSDFGRRLQLSWDRLVDLLGEELLARRVTELPDPPNGADSDTVEMFAQARRYAADPKAAAEELEEYRRRYPS
jgi:hypothetical protein